jgi:hypothetical protein
MSVHSRRGHRGQHILSVQRALNRQLPPQHPRAPLSGLFCDATAESVRRFQRYSLLEPTGEVCPATLTRLFGLYDLTIDANLIPRVGGSPARNLLSPVTPARVQSMTVSSAPNESGPRPMQLQLGVGEQFALSGLSTQFSLSFMFRRPHYNFSPSRDRHPENAFSFGLTLPNSPASIYTGQVGYTYTFADLETFGRWHLLNPFINANLTFPLNRGNPTPMPDPSSRLLLGGNVGTTVTFDIIPDYLSINLQGYGAANVNLRSGNLQFDTGLLLFFQGTFGVGHRLPPQEASGR